MEIHRLYSVQDVKAVFAANRHPPKAEIKKFVHEAMFAIDVDILQVCFDHADDKLEFFVDFENNFGEFRHILCRHTEKLQILSNWIYDHNPATKHGQSDSLMFIRAFSCFSPDAISWLVHSKNLSIASCFLQNRDELQNIIRNRVRKETVFQFIQIVQFCMQLDKSADFTLLLSPIFVMLSFGISNFEDWIERLTAEQNRNAFLTLEYFTIVKVPYYFKPVEYIEWLLQQQQQQQNNICSFELLKILWATIDVAQPGMFLLFYF